MKKLITLSMFFVAFSLMAQEETEEKKKFEFSGSVDAYFKSNITSRCLWVHFVSVCVDLSLFQHLIVGALSFFDNLEL